MKRTLVAAIALLALLMPAAAMAQSQTFYGADGRVSGADDRQQRLDHLLWRGRQGHRSLVHQWQRDDVLRCGRAQCW